MESSERFDAVVIGAGMAGLGAADELARRGRSVRILEAGPSAGGLARAIRVGGEPLEAYYHHIFPQDAETHELLRRLGLADRLEWHFGSMAVLHEGTAYPFDSALDLLRFRPMALFARVRAGAAIALQLVRRDTRTLDRRTAESETMRWFGRQAADILWRPLLVAKFGEEHYRRVAMAWLVARIRQRAGSRKAGGDSLGYLRGSLGTLIDAFAEDIRSRGVEIETSARVGSLQLAGGAWRITVDAAEGSRSLSAETVVVAAAGPVLQRLVELPNAYRTRLEAIPYRGVVCVLLELDRSVSPYYWTNVTDRHGFGCVGIIEHTNLIPSSRYGGRSVVYLAHYVELDGPAWQASADELIAAATPAIQALQPAFSTDWIRAVHVSRDRFAQPVPIAGGPMIGLPVETGLPGLYHASLAHIYPDDRGVSLALRLGARVARAADGYLEARG